MPPSISLASAGKKGAKRTFLFDTTEAELANPLKKIGYATKLPAVAKTGNSVKDEDAATDRTAFMFVIDSLWRSPSLCQKAKAWLEQRRDNAAGDKTDAFFESVSTLRALDDAWVFSFLSNKLNLPLDVLERACLYDPDSWRQILQFLGLLNLSSKLCKSCLQQEVVAGALIACIDANATRLSVIGANAFDRHSGGIRWAHMGVYKLTFDEENATHITHMPTNTTIPMPEHAPVTKAFTLGNNWSDFEAVIKLEPVSHKCFMFFATGQGPKSLSKVNTQSELFANAVTATLAKIAARERDAKKTAFVTTTKKFNEAAKLKQKQDQMLKARNALAVKKEALESKRTCKFE
jgi:hypothetical protein